MNGFLKNIMKRFIHQPGSDHPIHVRVIKMIRRNGNKFSVKDVFNFTKLIIPSYIITKIHPSKSINSPHLIQWAINLLKLIFFNIFLYKFFSNSVCFWIVFC